MKRYKVYTLEKGIVETDKYNVFKYLTWHREDGPAVNCYYNNGLIEFVEYWVNGQLHRLDGPAIIGYDINGNITNIEYCINDKEYTKEQYDNELLKLKVQSL